MFNQLLTHLSLSSLTLCIVVQDQVEQVLEDALDQVLDENSDFWVFVRRFWGGSCEHCMDYAAKCSDEGECRPSWWVWMILACIVLAIVVVTIYVVWYMFISG